MAITHLGDGHDVTIPQFLTRATLIDQLHAVADETGARFIEIALIVSRVQTTQAFTARSRAPENQHHIDASDSVENAGGIDAVGIMHDQYIQFLRTRPNAHRIPVVRGDIASSLQLIEQAIEPGA
jgi:hypothetical protein